MKTLFERLQMICRDQGKRDRQVDVARLTGLSPGRIKQISDAGFAANIGADVLLRLNKMGYSSVWVVEEKGSMKEDGPVADTHETLEDAPSIRPNRRIPLVGEVKAGMDGYLDELQYPVGHGDGFVVWPTADMHAYALRVRGDSMHPRYRAGEFVIVEPSGEAPTGEDVVVIFNDGRKMLKVLNWIRDDEIQLLSINDGFAPLTVLKKDIRAIHYAAGRAPRTALLKE